MEPLTFDFTLDVTDGAGAIDSRQWGVLSFRWTKRGIQVIGSPGLSNKSRFETLKFSEKEELAVACSKSKKGSPLFLFNKKGDVAQNLDEVSGVAEDDGYKYIVTYKKRVFGSQHLRELFLIDAEDMKSTTTKYGKPFAKGFHCEFCEIHHGIMVLKARGRYIFKAIHTYPGNFYNEEFDTYRFIDGYRWCINGEEKDLTTKMTRYQAKPVREDIIRNINYFVVYAANHPLPKASNTIRMRTNKFSFGDGILVVREGKDECYLIRYNDKTMIPIEKAFRLAKPLPKVNGVFYKRMFKFPEPKDITPDTDVNEMITTLIDLINERERPATETPFIPEECNNTNLIKVFENNLALIGQGWFTAPDGQRIELNVNRNIADETIFYNEEIAPADYAHRFDTRIEVRHIDCLDMARELVTDGGSGHVAVLSMANSRDPELRVTHGAKEQEAYLMRCTDYYNALVQHLDDYPIYGDFSGFFTPDVTVFRNSDYQMADAPWKVNIIAVAGLPRPIDESEFDLYQSKFHKKIRTILRIAIANGQTRLVLGALGCGGLHNIPNTIAEIFHSVLFEDEFAGSFEYVGFAMLPVEGEDEIFNAFHAAFMEGTGAIEKNQTLQTFQDEFKPYRFEGKLTNVQIRRTIKLIDSKQLNEYSAAEEIGYNIYFTLFKFAQWLRRQENVTKYNLDYLIKYEDDRKDLEDIIEVFSSEMLEKGDGNIYDELTDDYDELLIAIGYVYAVQQWKKKK